MVDFYKILRQERPRRVLICGDRNWTNRDLILRCVRKAHTTESISLIIEGEARGADVMGRCAAEECGILVSPFPAEWDRLGKRAGPIRNQQMLDEGKPTEVWAFHNDIKNSRGTRDMVQRSRKAGILVYVITEHGFNKYTPDDFQICLES